PNVLFNPVGADCVPLHRAGGWQRPGFANTLVADERLDIATDVSAAKRQPQRGPAVPGFRHYESDRPSGRPDIPFATALGRWGSVHAIGLLADHRHVSTFDARRLHEIPIAPPIALADNEIHVVGEFLRIIEVKAPLPVVIAVAKFARRSI